MTRLKAILHNGQTVTYDLAAKVEDVAEAITAAGQMTYRINVELSGPDGPRKFAAIYIDSIAIFEVEDIPETEDKQ